MNMHQIHYRIKTLSPILLTRMTGDRNMVSTLDYIPGSTVLGIFAKKYIEQNKLEKAHVDHYFYQSFLNSGLCFTNAYLTRNDGKDNTAYYPTPFSINSSKKNDADIFDLIIKYKEDTENIGNYCRIKDDGINFISAKKSINFHHARDNRLKGHSDEGIIFNYESLDPWQEFSGWIIGKQTDLNTILGLIDSPMKINIGRSRHIQYGEGELELIFDNPDTTISEITALDPTIMKNPFILTFWSPAIFYNECGFPSTSLLAFKNYLSSYLGVHHETIHITNSFKKSETIENFISIWQLKRPSDVCIKAGSCFEIEIDDLNDRIKNSLAELQVAGIGERTGEGLGRFLINMQSKEKYKSQNIIDQENKIPSGNIPEITQTIIKNVIIKSCLTLAEVQALKDCQGFCRRKDRIPTNSLLGKLILIVKESKDVDHLINKVSELPSTATDNIRNCKNDQVNLLEFIKTSEAHITDILNYDSDLKKCCNLIRFDPNVDEALMKNICSHYWLTFLAFMRKEKKRGRN